MASHHRLPTGAPHVEEGHLRPLLARAKVCRTQAHPMLLGSPDAKRLAPECAEIATECAEGRRAIGDMDERLRACRARATTG